MSAYIEEKLEEILPTVGKPARYTGEQGFGLLTRALGDRGLRERLRQSHVAHPVPPSGRERARSVRRALRCDPQSAHDRQLLRA